VLLLIGTNDMLQDYDVEHAPDRLSALVDQIMTTLPDSRVVVGTLPRLHDRDAHQRVQAYNAALPAVVRSKGPRVSLVDLYSQIQDADLQPDNVHLTAEGDRKLAAAWYAAVRLESIERRE
jgi:lysophospholipase L1-like esterase